MLRIDRMLALLVTVTILTGCQKESDSASTTATTDTTATTATEPAATSQPQSLTEGFSTPESVLYDPEQDVYFVSNINGSPLAVDDNGYISRVNAETLQVESKWLDASKQDVELNAPKGLAIVGDELWVSDITVVRKFDRRTGQSKGSAVTVPGATFLNDLATDGTNVYVSDSGMKAGASGFDPTGTDAVWTVSGSAPKKYASGKDLNRPNGLAVVNGAVWVVSFGANELFQIENSKKGPVSQMPKGSLDGLMALADGSVLVSSWEGKAVYRGNPGATFQAVVENVDSPADFGIDTKRNRLLIPHFMENRVSLHPLQQ
jgi:sugar lactone lactonase YvrE